MIEKIKENPKKTLGIVAGVFFLATILFMLLPCISLTEKDLDGSIYVSMFGLIFGGKIKFSMDMASLQDSSASINPMNLIVFILLLISLIMVAVLIFGLISEKFSKKIIAIIGITAIAFTIVSVTLIFVCKDSALHATIDGVVRNMAKHYPSVTEEEIIQRIAEYEANIKMQVALGNGSLSLGTGAIVPSIMAILGSASLTGVVCLTVKDNK